MRNKFWVVLGAANSIIGLAYFSQRGVDETHICRDIGCGLDISPQGKLYNRLFTTYHKFSGSYPNEIDLNRLCKQHGLNLETEATILTQNWAPSPLVSHSPSDLVQNQKRVYSRLSNAFNSPEFCFTPVGRGLLQSFLIQGLVNRKKIIQYASENMERIQGPGIDAENRLLIITGMHRSGSDLLQTLLNLDENCRTPRLWEMMDTIPPTKKKSDLSHGVRVAGVEKTFTNKMNVICPDWLSYMQDTYDSKISGKTPYEDSVLLNCLFQMYFQAYLLCHADGELVNVLRKNAPYICRFLHLYLKIEELGISPESHWVINNPDHCHYLSALVEEFPEANIVVTHRNPLEIVPSWALYNLHLYHHCLYNDFYQHRLLSREKWGEIILNQSAEESAHLVQEREILKATKPKLANRILDVQYTELVRDPVSVIRKIYKHFGYHFTTKFQNSIEQYMEIHPSLDYSEIPTSLNTFALEKETVEKSFAVYSKKYSNGNEV